MAVLAAASLRNTLRAGVGLGVHYGTAVAGVAVVIAAAVGMHHRAAPFGRVGEVVWPWEDGYPTVCGCHALPGILFHCTSTTAPA